MQDRQILYDPTGRRGRIVNIVGLTGILALAFAMTVFAAGFLIPPRLADLPKNSSVLPFLADGGSHLVEASSRAGFSALNSRSFPPSAAAAKRFAFFDMSNAVGRVSLLEHMTALDGLMPDFLVLDRNGELGPKSMEMEQRLRKKLQPASNLQIYPRLSNGSSNSSLASHLGSEAVSQKLIAEISGYLERNGDAGITLDFTEVQRVSHPNLFRFLLDLRTALHASGRTLILTFASTTDRRLIQEFSKAVDYVLVTLYRDADQGPAGPLASQGWFESQLTALRTTVDSSKLIVAIGSFAYDFGRPTGAGEISLPNAWHLLGGGGIELKFDEKSLNPWFRYTDASGVPHDVWLLDGVTAFNQIRAAFALSPAGLALSSLGMEDPSIWAFFGKNGLPDRAALTQLEHPPAAYYVDQAARKPEIFTATSSEKHSIRSVVFNESLGLAVKESFEHASPGKELVSWPPVGEKLLAITFDDGPDEKITGKVLDILAAKSVKATFFVIGKNALAHQELLRRAYRDGHDIGNHTYSHPRVSEISPGELELELTSTQRALEAVLGVHTRLFRPTYAGGVEDLENLPIIEAASKLGYLTVLSGIHSFDWLFPPPPVRKIHDAILNQVAAGQHQVILFHDQGMKQITLEVLPQIIDELRAKGFRFVTLHELIGKSRGDVMPDATSAGAVDNAVTGIRQSSLLAVIAFPQVVAALAIILAVITILRFTFVMIAASKHIRKERLRETLAYWPSIAVIVPAYNEEKVICKTIASVLASPNKEFQVIVVDDGSTDSTAHVVRQAYADEQRVKVLVKANGGKASAANFGLSHTDAEVVVCIDADTVLASDAITLLVRHFSDPSVGAVAGTAIVGNQINLLTRFQAMEYTIGQYLDRRAFALCNATGVVPGAIGAWRREALLAAGGYSTDTLAEDADATFAVTKAGWKVIYEPKAEARTEAPETLRGFLKQRHRWMFGTLQVTLKHMRSVYRRRSGLALLTTPNILISLLSFALFLPVLDTVSLSALAVSVASYLSATEPVAAAAHFETIAWWIIFQVLYLFVIAGALMIVSVPGRARLILMLLLQRFLYTPLLYWVAALILIAALKGRAFGWRKLARTGSVNLDHGLPEAAPAQ